METWFFGPSMRTTLRPLAFFVTRFGSSQPPNATTWITLYMQFTLSTSKNISGSHVNVRTKDWILTRCVNVAMRSFWLFLLLALEYFQMFRNLLATTYSELSSSILKNVICQQFPQGIFFSRAVLSSQTSCFIFLSPSTSYNLSSNKFSQYTHLSI